MPPRPLLSDIPATKTRYNAGDRVIVKVTTDLTTEQRHRLMRAVNKFAGVDVNSILVNTTKMGLIIFHKWGQLEVIAQLCVKTEESKLGMANVDLARVDFIPGDQLCIRKHPSISTDVCKTVFRNWAGEDIELIIHDIL